MGYKNLTHRQKRDRLFKLIKLTGLSYLGFEEFLGYKSEGKYIHAIKNGNKEVSKFLPEKIDQGFGFDDGTFLDLDKEFDSGKVKLSIKKFNQTHSESKSSRYFDTEEEHVLAIKRLISQDYFNSKRNVKEILIKLQELGCYYSSNDLSYKLVNLVNQKVLRAEKTIMVLKSGKEGTRLINRYWVGKNEK